MKKKLFLACSLLLIIFLFFLPTIYHTLTTRNRRTPVQLSVPHTEYKPSTSTMRKGDGVGVSKSTNDAHINTLPLVNIDEEINKFPGFVTLDPAPTFGRVLKTPDDFDLRPGNFIGQQILQSPDGKMVAFLSYNKDKTHVSLILHQQDSDKYAVIVSDAMSTYRITQFDWSPDSRYIAYIETESIKGDIDKANPKSRIGLISIADQKDLKYKFQYTGKLWLAGMNNDGDLFLVNAIEAAINVHKISSHGLEDTQLCSLPTSSSDSQLFYGYKMFQLRPNTDELYFSRSEMTMDSQIRGTLICCIALNHIANDVKAIDAPPNIQNAELFRWNQDGSSLATTRKGVNVYNMSTHAELNYPSNSWLPVQSFTRDNIIFGGTPQNMSMVRISDMNNRKIQVPYEMTITQ